MGADPQDFAGLAYDSIRRQLNVYVAGNPRSAARRPSLVHLAAGGVPSNSAGSVPVVFKAARRSAAQLQTVMDSVTANDSWFSGHGAQLNRWFPDPATGTVAIGVSRPTRALSVAALQRFGPAVRIVQADPQRPAVKRNKVASLHSSQATVRPKSSPRAVAPTATAPTRLLDSQPYYGGDRIVYTYPVSGGTEIVQCTGNFEYQNSGGTKEMGSAGHCSGDNVVWSQGYYDAPTHTIHGTGSMGTTIVSDYANNLVDAQVMYKSTYAPYVYVSSTQSKTVAGTTVPVTGATVCTDGSFNGQNCKVKISTVNACFNESEPGGPTVKFCHAAAGIPTDGSTIVRSGDSGGPVYINSGTTAVRAEGVIDASGANGEQVFFSMINYVQTAMGATVYS